VGKIGISDAILNKNGQLDTQENDTMKMHTIYGARLFQDKTSDWDEMAAKVALHHHERWDGTGYPGTVKNIYKENITFGKGKKGNDIPLAARIVALADVYDALISERAYKPSWSETRVMEYIDAQKDAQFDPTIVEAFFSIYDVIKAIQEKYAID
jgi:HD-GYP domain-containing protein (c-di-GMP phosphodiesterase class II)